MPRVFRGAQQCCRRKDARSSGVNFPDRALADRSLALFLFGHISVRRLDVEDINVSELHLRISHAELS